MIAICFVLTWIAIFSACWTLAHNWKTGFIYVKRLHQVPCHSGVFIRGFPPNKKTTRQCKYFTNSCYLKCTVNPDLACSEAAIDCRDYQPQ